MTFLAQLDLAEIRAAEGPDWLPDQGFLLFFYDFDHGAWGFSSEDAGSFKVVYEDGAMAAMDLPAAVSADDLFPSCQVAIGAALSYPSVDRLRGSRKQLPELEYRALETALKALSCAEPVHQISGYPVPIQSDSMELECQSVTSGLYLGDPSTWLAGFQIVIQHQDLCASVADHRIDVGRSEHRACPEPVWCGAHQSLGPVQRTGAHQAHS